MILYLDASALVKRYVLEWESAAVQEVIAAADLVGTAVITRAEVVAALAKARRVSALTEEGAAAARLALHSDWPHFLRLAVSEHVAARAADLAWQFRLRGYDAVHLGAAGNWQDALGEGITLATYDLALWSAAEAWGLRPYPPNLLDRQAARRTPS